MKEQMVSMNEIIADSNRKYGGEGDIRILAEDMKAIGLTHAVTLKQVESANPALCGYTIIAGRRRHAAAKMLGWKEIRANVYAIDEDVNVDAIAGSENINRLPMHALDEAEIFHKLMEAGETLDSLAKRYDRTKAAIFQRIQLLSLSDEIKELFRQDKISLQSAAMLKGLDEKQQKAFVAEASRFVKSGLKVPEHVTTGFISNVYNDKLYKCVADTECKSCKKRTFYSDKELFPELGDQDDKCLDHECYETKWRKLLHKQIKSITGEKKDHAGTNIIVTDSSEFKKIFGNTIKLDNVEYDVKKVGFCPAQLAEKKYEGAAPCLSVELYGGKLHITAKYWKEPAKEKEQVKKKNKAENDFEKTFTPIVKLLELPKQETEQTLDAIKKTIKDHWEISGKAQNFDQAVKKKVFNRILEIKAKQPEDAKDIEKHLTNWLDDKPGNKNIAKLFTGSDNVKALRKLSMNRLFTILFASSFYWNNLPEIENIAKDKKNDIAEWAGVSMGELRKMYKEELQAILPKPKTAKKTDKETVTKKAASVTKKSKNVKKKTAGVSKTNKPVKKQAASARKAKKPVRAATLPVPKAAAKKPRKSLTAAIRRAQSSKAVAGNDPAMEM